MNVKCVSCSLKANPRRWAAGKWLPAANFRGFTILTFDILATQYLIVCAPPFGDMENAPRRAIINASHQSCEVFCHDADASHYFVYRFTLIRVYAFGAGSIALSSRPASC